MVKEEKEITGIPVNSEREYFKFTKDNIKKLGDDIRLKSSEIDRLKKYLSDKKNNLLNKEFTEGELKNLLSKNIFHFDENQVKIIMNGIYDSHNNQWTEKEKNRYVKDNEDKIT